MFFVIEIKDGVGTKRGRLRSLVFLLLFMDGGGLLVVTIWIVLWLLVFDFEVVGGGAEFG